MWIFEKAGSVNLWNLKFFKLKFDVFNKNKKNMYCMCEKNKWNFKFCCYSYSPVISHLYLNVWHHHPFIIIFITTAYLQFYNSLEKEYLIFHFSNSENYATNDIWTSQSCCLHLNYRILHSAYICNKCQNSVFSSVVVYRSACSYYTQCELFCNEWLIHAIRD